MSAPSAPEVPWDRYWADLEELLAGLVWAGWSEREDDFFTEHDPICGPLLYATLGRTCMALQVEYRPDAGELRLQPADGDDCSETFSMIDSEVVLALPSEEGDRRQYLDDRFGELGLLDATRVDVADGSPISLGQFLRTQWAEFVVEDIAEYHARQGRSAPTGLDDDPYLRSYLLMMSMAGRGVVPDLVPDAATLGIAAWCWRNDTAVEEWHLASDVLMARVNIAVTKAIAQHVDPFEGVDWIGLEESLTDEAWALPDGRTIAGLFAEGWSEVCSTVRERLLQWRRLDEELLGPHATLRLLTIGGSTDYTGQWCGQGRWLAMCQRIIEDACAAGMELPGSYSESGAERLMGDLRDPDTVSDEVLDWLIDMPAGGADGPRGLRFHRASRPVVRRVDLSDWAPE